MGNKPTLPFDHQSPHHHLPSQRHQYEDNEYWPDWYREYRLKLVKGCVKHYRLSQQQSSFMGGSVPVYRMSTSVTESKTSLMKRLHQIDQAMLDHEHRELDIFSIPWKYVEEQGATMHFEHLCIGGGPMSMQKVIYVKSGSRAEGAMMARLLKDEKIIMETDEMYVFDTFSESDFGGYCEIPGKPGIYGVNRMVLFLPTCNMDANELKQLTTIIPKHAAYDDYIRTLGFTETLKVEEHGPAGTLDVTFTHANGITMYSSLDSVAALMVGYWAPWIPYQSDIDVYHQFNDNIPAGWPPEAIEWTYRERQWPMADIVRHVIEQPIFLVNKPSSPGIKEEWTLSFSLAEQVIAQKRTDGMKFTYLVFKTIFYCCFNFKEDGKEFSSYLAKTTFNRACEEQHPTFWNEENINMSVKFLFHKLLGYISSKSLPHYFLPKVNLIQHLPRELFMLMKEHVNIQRLLSDPLSLLPNNIQLICTWQERVLRQVEQLEKVALQFRASKGWPIMSEPRETVMMSYPEHKAMMTFKLACMKKTDMTQDFLYTSMAADLDLFTISLQDSDIVAELACNSIIDIRMALNMRTSIKYKRDN